MKTCISCGTQLETHPDGLECPNPFCCRIAHPATADPATFPKADEPKLCVHALPLHECEQMECRIRSVKEPPSAGTEQKERGEAELVIADLLKALGTTTGVRLLPENRVALEFQMGGYDGLVSVRERARKFLTASPQAAPTDGKTTPRTDAADNFTTMTGHLVTCISGGEFVKADFARQLERELNAATLDYENRIHSLKAERTADIRQIADLTARLARTEKRLGEAQLREQGATIQLDAIKKTTAPLIAENDAQRERITELEQHIVTIRAQSATSQARLVEVEAFKTQLKDALHTFSTAEGDILSACLKLENQLATSQAALAQAKQEGERLQGVILGQEEQLKALTKTDCGFGGYVDSLMNERDRLLTANSQLQEQLAALRPQGGQDKLSP